MKKYHIIIRRLNGYRLNVSASANVSFRNNGVTINKSVNTKKIYFRPNEAQLYPHIEALAMELLSKKINTILIQNNQNVRIENLEDTNELRLKVKVRIVIY